MYKSASMVWGAVLSDLKKQLTLSTYKTWFAGSSALEIREMDSRMILVVSFKNAFIKEQVEKRFGEQIIQCLNKNGIKNVELIYVLEKPVETSPKNSPLFSSEPESYLVKRNSVGNIMPSLNFSNFIVGPSNNLAYVAAKTAISQFGTLYNPLFIWGTTGVGKTHMLHAFGNEVLVKMKQAKVAYTTSEGFTNDYLESLQNKTQQAFRYKYRKLDLLLVDDIQFLAGKESTQDEFFHTFNEIVSSGGQVVIASDKHPKELGKLKERLVSRFLGGMVADIGLPDLETKIAILKTRCAEKNIKLEDGVIEYIAKETAGGVRELEGVFTSVLAYQRLGGREFGLENVRSTIGKFTVKKELNANTVVDEVCRHYKVRRESLCGSSRKSTLVFVRQIVMYFLRKDLGLSLEAIGDLLGGRDHSTVIHGVEKIEDRIGVDIAVRDELLRVRKVFNNN